MGHPDSVGFNLRYARDGVRSSLLGGCFEVGFALVSPSVEIGKNKAKVGLGRDGVSGLRLRRSGWFRRGGWTMMTRSS